MVETNEIHAGDTMSARGWRLAGGALGAVLAAALTLPAPARAAEQETARKDGQQETAEQQARASSGDQQNAPSAEETGETKSGQESAQPAAQLRKAPPPSNSLAAAAARIRLHRPADEGKGPVVITNQNLGEVAGQGTISEGGGVGSSPVVSAEPDGNQQKSDVNPANELVSRYLEQKRTVEALEARVKNFDEQLAKPPRDPHNPQSQNSPQFRAPGVVDNAEKQRDEVAKQLAEERTKLDALRARARREGVELTAPSSPAPPSTP